MGNAFDEVRIQLEFVRVQPLMLLRLRSDPNAVRMANFVILQSFEDTRMSPNAHPMQGRL
jgi:hypothetical protein